MACGETVTTSIFSAAIHALSGVQWCCWRVSTIRLVIFPWDLMPYMSSASALRLTHVGGHLIAGLLVVLGGCSRVGKPKKYTPEFGLAARIGDILSCLTVWVELACPR